MICKFCCIFRFRDDFLNDLWNVDYFGDGPMVDDLLWMICQELGVIALVLEINRCKYKKTIEKRKKISFSW